MLISSNNISLIANPKSLPALFNNGTPMIIPVNAEEVVAARIAILIAENLTVFVSCLPYNRSETVLLFFMLNLNSKSGRAVIPASVLILYVTERKISSMGVLSA